MDQGAVTGCGTGSCPDAFPVPAAAAGGSPVTCLTTRSRCSSVSGNFVFSLFRAGPPAVLGGTPTPTLERCIPSPAGITTCSSITDYTGLELYNSLGALVGCTTSSVTTCPTQFPIALYNAAGGLVSCRANLTGSCGAATGNQFPTQIFDDRVSNVLGTAAQPHASFSFCNYVSTDMPRSVLGYIRVVHCAAVHAACVCEEDFALCQQYTPRHHECCQHYVHTPAKRAFPGIHLLLLLKCCCAGTPHRLYSCPDLSQCSWGGGSFRDCWVNA
jgi:hypothetical protein